MSLVGIALLVAAVVLLGAMEWPRLGRLGIARPKARRDRGKRSHLHAVPDEDESDEFARSVERDLANLPTIDERDRR